MSGWQEFLLRPPFPSVICFFIRIRGSWRLSRARSSASPPRVVCWPKEIHHKHWHPLRLGRLWWICSLSLSLILIRPSTVRQLLILLQRTRSGGGGSIRPFSARYRIDRINELSLLLSLSYSTSPTLFRGKLLAGSDRSKLSISTTTTSRGDEEKMHRGRPPTLLTEHPS